MRRLTKTLAVMSLLAPASAYSLGIGSMKVHSGLNQNLNAEISLVTSANEDASDIKVSLASPAKFDQAKVPWAFFLSKIKFETIVKPNGSTVVKVTSNEALKEPFLDFLLEVSWPKGNLYRQFTVLLEPPADYQKASTADETSVSYENYEEPKPISRPQRPHYATTTTTPSKRHHRVIHIKRHSVGRGNNVTRKNDTLWKVAERIKKSDEPTVEQIMLAIYEANPQAFYKDNINALLPNKKLHIPKKEDTLKLSQDQASSEFNQHMRAWKNNAEIPNNNYAADTKPEPEATYDPADEPPFKDKQLTLVAPTDAPVADDAATALTHESSSTPISKTTDNNPKVGDANGQDGTAKTGVNVIAPGQDTKNSKENAAAPEDQLAAMQKTLLLKQQQLQAMQNGSKQPATTTPENTTPNQPLIPTPVINVLEPVEPVQQPPVVKPGTQPQHAKPIEITEPAEETSIYLWLSIIGAGLLALIGGLIWRKRKFDDQFDSESMFAPSSIITNDGSTSSKKPLGKDNNAHSTLTGTDENSFLNEFTASDFEVFDTSHVEIDPISETDVYLAYGRYQQAEELMRQAIKDQPNNDEYKLKLLEIFCATERKKDFVKYATNLADTGKKSQAEFWGKVVEMGHEVWPDLTLESGEELFTAPEGTTENIYANLTPPTEELTYSNEQLDTVDYQNNDNDNDQSIEIATFDSSFEDSLLGSPADPFAPNNKEHLSNFPENIDEAIEIGEKELQNNDSLDFDLGSFTAHKNTTANQTIETNGLEQKSPIYSLNKATLESTPTIEILDFDTDRIAEFTLDNKQQTHSNAENTQEDIVEFNFDEFNLPQDNRHQDSDVNTAKPTAASTLDTNSQNYEINDDFDFDLDFDLSTPASESAIHYLDQEEAGGFDFMDLDELETKLDLAKAYIDMGDNDSAKEIIAEVLDKGNAEQVKIARSLFDTLV